MCRRSSLCIYTPTSCAQGCLLPGSYIVLPALFTSYCDEKLAYGGTCRKHNECQSGMYWTLHCNYCLAFRGTAATFEASRLYRVSHISGTLRCIPGKITSRQPRCSKLYGWIKEWFGLRDWSDLCPSRTNQALTLSWAALHEISRRQF